MMRGASASMADLEGSIKRQTAAYEANEKKAAADPVTRRAIAPIQQMLAEDIDALHALRQEAVKQGIK